jgi:hypothetical protein
MHVIRMRLESRYAEFFKIFKDDSVVLFRLYTLYVVTSSLRMYEV